MRSINSFKDIDTICQELDELTERIDKLRGDLEDYYAVYNTMLWCSTPCDDDGSDGTFNIVSKERLRSLYDKAVNEVFELGTMTDTDPTIIYNAIDGIYDYAKDVNFALIQVATRTNVGELLLHKAEMTYDAILRDLECTTDKLSNDEEEN